MGRCDVIEVPEVAVRPTVDDVIAHVWSDAALNPTDSKAVLTLTLEDAAMVNSTVIGGLPGASTLALSVDTYADCKEPDMYPEDFVRGLFISGVPPGQLELKVGGRYIIIRNIDQRNGIVNGAHIICTSVTQRHVIGAASMLYAATTSSPHCNFRVPIVRSACRKESHVATNIQHNHTRAIALTIRSVSSAISSHSRVRIHRAPLAGIDVGFAWTVLQWQPFLPWSAVHSIVEG